MFEILQAVGEFISTVGFPIAACGFLLWQNAKNNQYFSKQLDELRESLKTLEKSFDKQSRSIDKLAESIKELISQ